MPQIIKSENWDSVLAPKIPRTWQAAANFQTSTTIALSSPNSLRYVGGNNNLEIATYIGSTDQNNGDARVSSKVYFTGEATGNVAWFLALRSDIPANNCYGVLFEPGGSFIDGVTLFKIVNGVATQLGSTLGVGAIALNGWYYVQLIALGIKLAVFVQRLSDSQWLSAAGWVPYKVNLLNTVDSSITGSGYFGVQAGQGAGETNPQYLDDFLAENLLPDVMLIRRRFRPKQALTPKIKRPKRVRSFGVANTLFRSIGGVCTWSQTDNPTSCGLVQACDTAPPNANTPAILARFISYPGGKPSVLDGSSLLPAYVMQSEPVGITPNWPGGDWGIRLHVTAVDHSGEFAWSGIRICRLDSSCNNLGTIGVNIFPTPIPITIPTIYGTQHVMGAEQDGTNPGDTFYIICYFTITGGFPGNHTFTITPDQFIDTPFCGIGPIMPDPIDKGQLRWSANLRRPTRTKRRLRFPPQLLNPQSPPTGPFDPSLFRNKRRSVRFLPLWIRKHRPGQNGRKEVTPAVLPIPKDNSAIIAKKKARHSFTRIRRLRWRYRIPPLMPIQIDTTAPMAATALVEETYLGQGLLIEEYAGTALVSENYFGLPNVIGVS